MKKLLALLLALCLIPISVSCSFEPRYFEHSFFALDTAIEIRLFEGEYDQNGIFTQCERIITEGERMLSFYDMESSASLINREADVITDLPEDVLELITLANKYSILTDGVFDITVGALTELTDICNERNKMPEEGELAAALETVGHRGVLVKNGGVFKSHKGTKVDFGGIAEGYLAEKLTAYLEETEATGGIASVGNTVGVFGAKKRDEAYSIGLRSPFEGEDNVGTLMLKSGFASSTGNDGKHYDIEGVKYGRLIDPRSGELVANDILSLSVVSKSGAMSDALSTALYIMGYEEAVRFHRDSGINFEMIIIRQDGITVTEGLRDSFKVNGERNVIFCE